MAYKTRSLPRPKPIGPPKDHQYGRRWANVSKQGLARQPIFEDCLGPADLRHHEQPVDELPDLKYAEDNHVSLCHDCHVNRHKKGLVTKWRHRPGRFVIWGLPATGKTTLAHMIATNIWDMDEYCVARRWVPRQLTPNQIQLATVARDQWIASQDGDCALICVSPHTAYNCGASLQAKMIHCWCVESERQRRLEKRHVR